MSFKTWFKRWIISFFKILTVGRGKYKSEAQREKEREQRLKAKYSGAKLYPAEKKHRKRCGNAYYVNLINAIFGFLATSLGILLLPLGLLDWGRKSAKLKKAKAARIKSDFNAANGKKTSIKANVRKDTKSDSDYTVGKDIKNETEKNPNKSCSTGVTELPKEEVNPQIKAEIEKVQDENMPKSAPKNEKDRYIRKRMIIAGSYYCDKNVLNTLNVGTYFDIESEPDNLYDKDAIKLMYNGKKIGYVAKQDSLPFVTCLKLKNNIYGVITDIKNEEGRVKYEFETWFDLSI